MSPATEVEATKFDSLTPAHPAPMTSNDQFFVRKQRKPSKGNQMEDLYLMVVTWASWAMRHCLCFYFKMCVLFAGMSKFSAPIVDPKWSKSFECEFRMENSNELKGWHLDSSYSSSPISHMPWPLDAMYAWGTFVQQILTSKDGRPMLQALLDADIGVSRVTNEINTDKQWD